MFLSKLVLNPRSRQVRRESAQPYELHRTLMRAFPDRASGGPGRVLFRLDAERQTGALTLLVQSGKKPDWSRLSVGQDYLVEPPKFKTFQPSFAGGQRLAFRLRANPTVKRGGKRLGLVREEDQQVWLRRKAAAAGFRPSFAQAVPEGLVHGRKLSGENRHDMSFLSVRFDGLLQVLDADHFVAAVRNGIGSGKGVGFGLLSLAKPD